MSAYRTTLAAREEIAEGTAAFHFALPSGFSFTPGQAIDLFLPGPPTAGDADVRHAFSIVSAPAEQQFTIATRMRDSVFKRKLGALRIGATVAIEGPFGSLVVPMNHAVPAVLIAGGIGITPFMSILRQAARDRSHRSVTLIYSNRRPEDAAFLVELQHMAQSRTNFLLVATMTQMSASNRPWSGLTGAVDADLLTKVVDDVLAPHYYVVGPPQMVESMRATLKMAGVGSEAIHTEEFFGY